MNHVNFTSIVRKNSLDIDLDCDINDGTIISMAGRVLRGSFNDNVVRAFSSRFIILVSYLDRGDYNLVNVVS